MIPLLDERSEHLTHPLDLAQPDESVLRMPLSIHARHTVDDVLSAFGILDFDRPAWKQTGVIRDERTNSDLFFVTLEKSEREYSPSTLYKDYAISPVLFHWESQSTTTQQSNTGQRYIHHRDRHGNILLFVRSRRKQDGRTMPTRSSVSHTTSPTRGSGQSASSGDCRYLCPRMSSGRRRSRAASRSPGTGESQQPLLARWPF